MRAQQPHQAGAGGDAHHVGDLVMLIALDVVEEDHDAQFFRQLPYSGANAVAHIQFDRAGTADGRRGGIEWDLMRRLHFALLYRVEDDGNRYVVQPRSQSRIATKLMQSVERPKEDVLCQVLRQLGVARHAQRQPEDPVDVFFIERAFKCPIMCGCRQRRFRARLFGWRRHP